MLQASMKVRSSAEMYWDLRKWTLIPSQGSFRVDCQISIKNLCKQTVVPSSRYVEKPYDDTLSSFQCAQKFGELAIV